MNKPLALKYKVRKRIVVIGTVIALMLLGTAIIFYATQGANQQTVRDSRPDIEDVLTVEGKVTLIQRSCGAESIYPSEDMTMYAMCGKASAVRIDDDTVIYTSTGGPKPDFQVNISSVSLGDYVRAYYVSDDTYGASLNCKQCSITTVKDNQLSIVLIAGAVTVSLLVVLTLWFAFYQSPTRKGSKKSGAKAGKKTTKKR